MAWTNNDGLVIRFGAEKATPAFGGESSTDGNNRVITLDLAFSDLAATGTEKIIGVGSPIPDGAVIKTAKFHVSTAFVGASATLTFGLIDLDQTTAYDADGIDAAIAVGALTAGATITCDGAVVGKLVSNSGTAVLLTATEGTAAFTAGAGQLVVEYYIP
jgi:hypothetical protein